MRELAVTTSGKCSPKTVEHAKEAAREWGVPFLERGRKAPLGPMLEKDARALLVFGEEGLTPWDRPGALRFSPGMARLRLKRLDAGIKDDLLVRTAGFEPGQSVLDCTLGLGADALVSARAVGIHGQVFGLEKSLPLYALVSEGLARYQAGAFSCRVVALHADAAAYLIGQLDQSFDHVLFDPMFARPRRSSPSFDTLRRFADHSPLTPQMLRQAARVARRSVLVKGSRYSNDLRKLGLLPEPGSPNATVLWARLVGKRLEQARSGLTCPAYPPEDSSRRSLPKQE